MLCADLDSCFAFEFAPAHDSATYSGKDGFDHLPLHHLAVTEALDQQPPQKLFLLSSLHHKSQERTEPIDSKKQRIVENDLVQIGRCVGIFLLMFKMSDQ